MVPLKQEDVPMGEANMITPPRQTLVHQLCHFEAMMMSCAIDAREGRHVAVTDIPEAFLQADMEEDVHMLLEGTIVELIVKLDPSLYRKYIWENKNGKPMLYVKQRKTLYWTL